MAYFRNRDVNLFNLHYAIHSIARGGGGAFFLVFLLKAGVSTSEVLLALAGILVARFIIRPIVIPLGIHFGLRTLITAGTLLTAVPYILLSSVHGVGSALYALVAMSALGDAIYWPSFHAYFAALGDDEHRGQQIGAREAIAALIGIVSPLGAGWLLVSFGPQWAFGANAAIAASAALPFLWMPQVKIAPRAPGAFRAAVPGILIFTADGWIQSGYNFIWQIVLFIAIGQSFLAFGGALAIAAVVGAIGGMVLGRHIDAGHGGRAVTLAFGAIAFLIALRAVSAGHPATAVIANALGSLAGGLYVPTMMTAVYNQAKRSPCPLRFHMMTEGGWDAGGAAGLLLAALMIRAGLPLASALLASLLGVVAGFVLLRRYYQRHAELAVQAVTPVGE